MTTHLDDATLHRYAVGALGGATAMSAEAHLLACATCRAVLADEVDSARLQGVWEVLSRRIDDARASRLERLLGRAGLPDPYARVVAATPSPRAGWVVAVLTTLVGAMAATAFLGRGHLPFLVVAPMAPVLGVALAYGRRSDPVWEVSLATPFGGFPLLLVRAATVVLVCTAVAGLLSLLFPGPGLLAVAWLVPSLALTALTLALASPRSSTTSVAVGVCAVWVTAVVVSAQLASDPFVAFGAVGQLLAAAAGCVGVVVLLSRRHTLEPFGGAA